jgi:ankyrin repeat protein
MVTNFLRKASDPNIEDVDGKSPLHLAIIQQDAILCEILLEPRPGVGFTANNLRKAWHWATEAGGRFIMTLLKTLQAKRQSLRLLDNPGSSSALSRSWKALQLVLSADQETRFTEKDLDFTLRLSRAAEASNQREPRAHSTTKAISLWNGSSLVVSDPNETVREAFVKGAGHTAALLLQRLPVDVNHMGENGESALHLAVIYDAPSAVDVLLQNDELDTAATDPQDGYTAIELSLILGRLDILRKLLNSGAVHSIGHIHRRKASCLHLAIKQRLSDAIPLLLSYSDVPVNHLDATGRTALHYAILQDNSQLVEVMLACPQTVAETPSLDGRTALHYAALSASSAVLSLLLNTEKFNPDHRDSYGKNAHDWAMRNTYANVAGLLHKYALELKTRKEASVEAQVITDQ